MNNNVIDFCWSYLPLAHFVLALRQQKGKNWQEKMKNQVQKQIW